MKYEKDFQKVSFGFGHEKVAGKGDLSETIDGEQKLTGDRAAIITIALQAFIVIAGLLFKSKISPKKDKKKAKNKKKR